MPNSQNNFVLYFAMP